MNYATVMNYRILLTILFGMFMFGLAVQTADAATPKTAKQQLKQDKKYKGFAEKQLEQIRKYLTMDSLKSAERSVKQAEKYVSKISAGFMAGAEGSALRSELDDLKKQVGDKLAGAAAASENADVILQEKINYSTSVRKYAHVYYLLDSGKTKSNEGHAYGLNDIEALRDNLSDFVAYEAEFRSSFPNLITAAPSYNYEGITPANLLDLIANANEYQANFTEVVGNLILDTKSQEVEGIISGITEYKRLPSHWLDDLYGRKQTNEHFGLDTRLKPYYDAVSRPLPAERMKKLAAYKPKIKKMLAATAKTMSWDGKEYSVHNGDMRNVAEHFTKKKGWKLIEYGSTDTAYLKKNALGIPLHKYYEGMIVVRVDNEPFDRGYGVRFYDYFDGKDYQGISDMKVASDAWPYGR